MDKRGFSSTEHNTKITINAMAPQKIQIIEEVVSNNEVIMSKATEGSVTNGSNLMDISIEDKKRRKITIVLTSVLMTRYYI